MTISSELNSFNECLIKLKNEHSIEDSKKLTSMLQSENSIYFLSTIKTTFVFNILVATKLDNRSFEYNKKRSVLFVELLEKHLDELSDEVLWHIIDSINIFTPNVVIEKDLIKNILKRFNEKYKKERIIKVFNYV